MDKSTCIPCALANNPTRNIKRLNGKNTISRAESYHAVCWIGGNGKARWLLLLDGGTTCAEVVAECTICGTHGCKNKICIRNAI